MSIAKMNKVTIIGTKDKQEEILKKLQKFGFFQVEDMSHLAQDEEFKDIFNKQDKNEEISSINQKLVNTEKAIANVKKYYKVKKSMFAGKEYYNELSTKDADDLYSKVQNVNEISNLIEEDIQKVNTLNTQKVELEPWTNFSISADLEKINYIKIILGTITLKYSKEEIENALNKEKVEYSINIINKDKHNLYLSITTKNEEINHVKRILKKFDFNEKDISLENETVTEKIQRIEEEILKLQNVIEENKAKIKPDKIKDYENLYDYYLAQKDLKLIERNIVTTNNTFYLEGWMPEGCKINNNKEFIIKVRPEEENEEVPVLVEDNRIVEPFQSITNMYSVPNKRELDPNPVMAIFYILFFGLMLSDVGYGLLLTLGCLFLIRKKKYARGEGKLVKLLTYCGIASVAWGFFFGSFFGDLIPIKGVLNPLKDVMPLMGLALLLGIVHIYTGMLMKAIQLIREKKIFDAICDIGFWYLLLTGVFLLVIPIVAGDIGIFSEIGKYLAIIGVIGVILTGGRKEKNIIKKCTKGVSSLYDITSYLSDVLSYSRLMALCLSTGVIAQVVNLLGGLVGPIPAILVGIIGHGFNLANSALGSYVHTSRLQYVEFFGKFYEGGGKEFTPFRYKNKYTKIKEEF